MPGRSYLFHAAGNVISFLLGALSQDAYIDGAHELVSLLNGEPRTAASGISLPDGIANIAIQHTDLMLR